MHIRFQYLGLECRRSSLHARGKMQAWKGLRNQAFYPAADVQTAYADDTLGFGDSPAVFVFDGTDIANTLDVVRYSRQDNTTKTLEAF